jgi:hypothetical protein
MQYKEVIHPPLWLIVFVYFLFLSMVLSIWAALGNTPAIITFGISTAWLVDLYYRTSLKIEITDHELRIGAARIDRQYIGETVALTSKEAKLIRTRDADPAAYLAIRFWTSKAVKMQLSDSRDSTPYWLITSNNPQALAAALKS